METGAMMMFQLNVKEKTPAEEGRRGCPTTCAAAALKEFKIDENKKTPPRRSNKETTTTKRKDNLRLDDDDESSKFLEEWSKKRRKKVMLRLSKEYVDYLEKHPPSPPYKPIKTCDWFLCDVQDSIVAEETAEREERDRILQQYDELGYAEKAFDVTDDEE